MYNMYMRIYKSSNGTTNLNGCEIKYIYNIIQIMRSFIMNTSNG